MTYHIFCDESRQTQNRYMVLGGLLVSETLIPLFNATMLKFRKEQNMMAELKWSKVSNQKELEYKRFIEYFFALNNNDNVHFHCMIIDTTQLNHKKYSNGDKEIGFYKFYYQLLLNCFARNYLSGSNDTKFIVHLDQRETKYKLSDLTEILNHGIRKKLGIIEDRVRSIQPIDSKKSDLLQINDIILGAIGYQKNGNHLIAGTKTSKINLSEFISKQAGLPNLQQDTKYGMIRFKIWNIKFNKK